MRGGRKCAATANRRVKLRTPFKIEAKFDVGPGTPQINAIPLVTDVVGAAVRATNLSEINVPFWDLALVGFTCHG